jgi:hypothetical protein
MFAACLICVRYSLECRAKGVIKMKQPNKNPCFHSVCIVMMGTDGGKNQNNNENIYFFLEFITFKAFY